MTLVSLLAAIPHIGHASVFCVHVKLCGFHWTGKRILEADWPKLVGDISKMSRKRIDCDLKNVSVCTTDNGGICSRSIMEIISRISGH